MKLSLQIQITEDSFNQEAGEEEYVEYPDGCDPSIKTENVKKKEPADPVSPLPVPVSDVNGDTPTSTQLLLKIFTQTHCSVLTFHDVLEIKLYSFLPVRVVTQLQTDIFLSLLNVDTTSMAKKQKIENPAAQH